MKKMKLHYPEWAASDAPYQDTTAEQPERALVEAIAVTAEVCGQTLSAAAARTLAADLKGFQETAVLSALSRCRLELQGRLRAADILARIDDGRPGAEEAWAMMPASEQASVVWTEEMAQSWGAALPFLNAGDPVAAHAAFRARYDKAVLEARILRKPLQWMPSLGSDASERERVLREAVAKRRLSAAHAESLLPAKSSSGKAKQIIAKVKIKRLH